MSEVNPTHYPQEAQSELTETGVDREYQDILWNAKIIHEASPTSIQEALAEMDALEQRLLYAVPDADGVLVLNQVYHQYHKPEEDIERTVSSYAMTMDKIFTYGYLQPDARSEYQRTFTTSPAELRNRRALLLGETLTDPLRMFLDNGETTEDAMLDMAGRLGLPDVSLTTLKDIAASKDYLEANPDQGSNFLYHYTAPFVEVGTVDGEVKARLGVIFTHLNDSAGLDTVSFMGVQTPADETLSIISESLERFALQAEEEKSAALEALTVQRLVRATYEAVYESREASATAFVGQLKRFAPESKTFSDDELLAMVKSTALNSYGYGQPYPDASPAELHMIKVMADKDARFGGITKKDDQEALALDRSESPPFWEPQSWLFANGSTGLVTRIDYQDSPAHVAASGREIGRETFDAEKSARLRKQMFQSIVSSDQQKG